MKTLIYTFFLFSIACQIFAQTKQFDLYTSYQTHRPKYKKINVYQIRYDIGSETTDTILVSKTIWTKHKLRRTDYWDDIFNRQACNQSTYINIYNPLKRNVIITKYYKCDSLLSVKHRVKTLDSTFTFTKNREIIFKSKFDKVNNSWTAFYKSNRSNMKTITLIDSIKTTVLDYRNDSLIEKNIDFTNQNLTDSSLCFDASNKLSYKTILRYNKYRDVEYIEKINYMNAQIDIVKTTITYVYDKNTNWIEQIKHNEYYPKNETSFGKEYERGPVKEILIRKITY